jgi:adenine-specific DNA-methyltransferase
MSKKVSDQSTDLFKSLFQKFKEFFPLFVREGEVDFDGLQKFFKAQKVLSDKEKYGLTWAGKGNAFKAIQTKSVGTLVPQKTDSKSWDTTENLFIEGDNLEVLKLLQKNYREKIKIIYIDPPYNTGHDFVYKDNFTESVADYYEKTGQSENGVKMSVNTEKNGRFHSDWLTMMYPRLFLARNLMTDDGVIFVSIDDNEAANLRLVCDEIFGEENFVAQVVWRKKKAYGRGDTFFIPQTEYVLVFRKTDKLESFGIPVESEKIIQRYKHEDEKGKYELLPLWHKSPTGPYIRPTLQYSLELDGRKIDSVSGQFLWKKDRIIKEYENNNVEIVEVDGKYRVYSKAYLEFNALGEERTTTPTSYYDGSTTSDSAKEISELFDMKVFDYSKPTGLIKHLVRHVKNSKECTVLDFFAGSGTTAHAVMSLNSEDEGNRKFMCVQIPEELDKDSEAYKAGYKTIAEISKERVRRAGEKVKKENQNKESGKKLDIGFKVFKLQNSNFRKWNILTSEAGIEEVKSQAKLLIDKPLVDKYKEEDVVQEVLLKEGFSLNSQVTKRKAKSKLDFFFVQDVENSKQAYITFEEKLTKEKVDKLEIPKDTLFVCFDSALDDNLKANISRNINLKVI